MGVKKKVCRRVHVTSEDETAMMPNSEERERKGFLYLSLKVFTAECGTVSVVKRRYTFTLASQTTAS